ncbi:MAG TPA: VWA domain-containing protein [Pyrinomonadaceae bacterium]|nr:VWA domain-containing protein [Pyrinomonadaceae bacterium]
MAEKYLYNSDEEENEKDAAEPLEKALRERLRSVRSASERRTIAGLAREIGKLPADTARAALEVSAGLASVSLRAGVDFLRVVPEAAQVLDAEELRAWGDMGRRLVMADVETGSAFITSGAGRLSEVPRGARLPLLRVCARQLTLSTSVALETYRMAGEVAREVGDEERLRRVFEVALEISRRSAKHSADFVAATPAVAARLSGFDEELDESRAVESRFERERIAESLGARDGVDESAKRESVEGVEAGGARVWSGALALAGEFAARVGGIASDVWSALPAAVEGLSADEALMLFRQSQSFLERGGTAALNVLAAGGEVLRLAPGVFDDWEALLRTVASHNNACLVSLARTGPAALRALAEASASRARLGEIAHAVVETTHEVARVDAEAAISCFRSTPQALRSATVEQFREWAREGLLLENVSARARRSYFALETRRSNERLQSGGRGLALEDVAQTLRLYVEGLTGRAVEVAPLAAVPDEQRIGDGRTIHLPSSVSEFEDGALDFRLYKVLAAHAAGQIEFGTHERDTLDLRAAYESLAELYAPENADALDAFALDGYINDPSKSERALAPEEEARLAESAKRRLPEGGDYRAVLALFPQSGLATRIFGTLENGRIDRRLRHTYRGLARDLDLVREHLRRNRPRIVSLPVTLVPFELVFQITLCGGALDDARAVYGQIVSELETIVVDYLTDARSTVADTLMATSRVYTLFQSVVPEIAERQSQHDEERGDERQTGAQSNLETGGDESEDSSESERVERRQRDARELFNAWAAAESADPEGETTLTGQERWMTGESAEQDLEPGEEAFEYDEWDRDLSDTRVGWCRVVEKRTRRGDMSFVELTRSRYRGVISSIRHQFQLMKPESLKRIANELDGDDYDLNALIDYVIDRRADGQQSERVYTKRLRRERDVAVSFLLDQSSSTARTIGRHPLQPYTHPGRRIIEVEKEGLVLMSEALEAVGDPYSIYGFTSEGRRNVKFYVVKDFDEPYAGEVERRIGGINYQNNTRLGAAVRHAAAKLRAQGARTRLLIVLSDGRPYDHDYGDARYAREDTREALRQARLDGITPFCITIDRDSEAELRDLYGEIGYTIIDDVLTLPERMPAIYRRLTT